MTTRDNSERNARALELHLAGVPFARIAAAIGLTSKSAAYEAVQAAIKAKQEAEALAPQPDDDLDVAGSLSDVVDAGIRTELARLDAMLTGLWPRARQGDVKAVDRVLKLGERRQALLTLAARATPPAPAPTESTGEGVARVGDIAAARARRLAASEGPPPP